MDQEKINLLKKKFAPNLEENISFSDLTTVKIGGPARIFIEAKDQVFLCEIIKFAKANNIPYLVIGGGSNLLVSDKGVNKLVVRVKTSGIKQTDKNLVVQAGTKLQDLVDFTISKGLSGLNKMTGIPGTVGGAIYGNAGAYGQTISDYIKKVHVFDGEKDIYLQKTGCDFGYRTSGFQKNNFIILEVEFGFSEDDSKTLEKEAKEVLGLRLKKYKPGLKCPGSFFRNFYTSKIPKEVLDQLPERIDTYGKTPAYIFLEELGAKGDQIGDVKIADHHANLFINLQDAMASDFWQLANKWYKRVKEVYGVKLENEVQLINLPPFE